MQSLWQFYLLGLLLGVAITGLGDIPAGAVVSQWFGQQRGLALGLVYTGSNIGGSIVPLVATAVAAESSWREALRVLAVVRLGAHPAVRTASGSASDAAAAPAGDAADLAGMTLAEARRTPSFWLLGGVLFLFYFYYLGVNHHLVAFLGDAGFSDASAARQFSAAVAVGIAGKIGMGLRGRPAAGPAGGGPDLRAHGARVDPAARRRPGATPAAGLFLVVHGFTVAAENVMLPLVVVECFGVRHLAQIYGALMLALLPGGLAGPTFAGWVVRSPRQLLAGVRRLRGWATWWPSPRWRPCAASGPERRDPGSGERASQPSDQGVALEAGQRQRGARPAGAPRWDAGARDRRRSAGSRASGCGRGSCRGRRSSRAPGPAPCAAPTPAGRRPPRAGPAAAIGDLVEPLGVLVQQHQAVAAIDLLVGEEHARRRQRGDEIGIATGAGTVEAVTGGARHPRLSTAPAVLAPEVSPHLVAAGRAQTAHLPEAASVARPAAEGTAHLVGDPAAGAAALGAEVETAARSEGRSRALRAALAGHAQQR